MSTIAVWEDRFEQHTLTVRWWMDALDSNAYFLPSLCDSLSRWCMNATIWTRETSYQLQDGKDGIRMLPFWRYYVKIFVKIGNDVYPPGVYKEIQTACSGLRENSLCPLVCESNWSVMVIKHDNR